MQQLSLDGRSIFPRFYRPPRRCQTKAGASQAVAKGPSHTKAKEASKFRQKVTSKIKFVQPVKPMGNLQPTPREAIGKVFAYHLGRSSIRLSRAERTGAHPTLQTRDLSYFPETCHTAWLARLPSQSRERTDVLSPQPTLQLTGPRKTEITNQRSKLGMHPTRTYSGCFSESHPNG
jgi:hypothetical protein